MACTQKKQLVNFPKVRIPKQWFRYFFDHKEFHNEGNLHLFSLMALYSYANFRSNVRQIGDKRYMEGPGQWICKVSALPRILRVHNKAKARELMDSFRDAGFLDYEVLDEETELLRYTIADWKEHCVHLEYNYYSYKGSGFFFFPLPVGRRLIRESRRSGKLQMSELDAIMDLWLHTIHQDDTVRGSEYMPVVYYADMKGSPLLSYSYLAKRWGWSKSRVGRFILKIEEAGIISRVSFSSSRGSVISPCKYREMLYGDDCEQLQLQRIGEILGIAKAMDQLEEDDALQFEVQTGVPSETAMFKNAKVQRIQVFRRSGTSFFARPVPLIFYSSLDWGECNLESGVYRGPPKPRQLEKGADHHGQQEDGNAPGD